MDHSTNDPQQPQQAQVLDDNRLTDNENLLWSRFADAGDLAAFCQSWLALQCRQIDEVHGAIILLRGESQTSYVPTAVWPDVRQDMQHLTTTAERALRERSGVVVPNENSRFEIAYPIEAGDRLYGVVVLELIQRAEPELQGALRELHWGIAWLVDRFRRGQVEQAEVLQKRMMTVLDLAASAVEQNKFQSAATKFVTELATRLQCDRVAIGFVRDLRIELAALSNSAHFKNQSNLIRAIEAAMDEAVDQEGAVIFPAFDGDSGAKVMLSHERLHQLTEGHAVASVPFGHDGKWLGALTLERSGNKFRQTEIELSQAAVALAGPMLNIAKSEDRWIGKKCYDSAVGSLSKLLGAGHVLWKAAGLVLLAILAFLSLAVGEYRVSADAVAEGGIQRAVVAPFNGFIESAPVRAGELVEANQLMARLDDQDLQLERVKWESQRDQYVKELRQTKAGRDKARMGILSAQINQAEAQLALVNDQLKRTELRAPQAGVIVSGDLSKKLGAPLDKGEVLFEIAPLDDYRIAMQIDDRDISNIDVGQDGHLVFSAVPNKTFPITVTLVTPVASTEEGRNYFRVEASLDEGAQQLRPGMEGVAKIEIGDQKLIWIWTHRFTDWLKLTLWSWWP